MDNDIRSLAQQLGRAVARTHEATTLRDLRRQLDSQPEIMKSLDEFHQHSDRLAQLEAENKPIEVADKRKLQELHSRLISSDLFKRYTAAQMEYVELMRQVSDAVREPLGEVEQ